MEKNNRCIFLVWLIVLVPQIVYAADSPSVFRIRGSGLIWDQPPVLPPHEPEPGELPLGHCAPVVVCESPEPACPIPDEPLVEIKPFGFVKWEAFFDTRQIISLREGSTLLFPAPRQLDRFRQDINAHGFWNMTNFESRWGILLKGPDWDRVSTDGLLEADFRGSFETGVFNFRLRNAYARILWDNGYILFGQWWHPLWIPECFPHTLGFGIGAPIDPQAREPQVRLTQWWNGFELTAALLAQGDYQSWGPVGPSPIYMQDAVIPNLHLQMRAYFNDHVIGVAGDYKRLCPRIVSCECVKVKEHIDSFIFEAFAAFNRDPWSFRTKVFWAQNGSEHNLISGFGVRTKERKTDIRTYANTACVGAWFDFSYRFYTCERMELGCFVGGSKNLGSHDALHLKRKTGLPTIYALLGVAQNIDYVVEVTPRFIYMRDPLRAGVELQYKRASWGTPNCFGKVENGCPVDDFRVLFVVYYMF